MKKELVNPFSIKLFQMLQAILLTQVFELGFAWEVNIEGQNPIFVIWMATLIDAVCNSFMADLPFFF